MRTPTESLRKPRPRWAWLLAGVATVVAAVAIVVAVRPGDDETSDRSPDLTDDIVVLLDDYYAAWNAWDADAYLALMADDATHRTPTGSRTAREHARFITGFRVIELHVAPVGEPIVSGEGPWYLAQVVRLTATTYTDDRGGVLTLTIVEEDGQPKIARHEYAGRF